MTTQQTENPTQTTQRVSYHWVMTVQTADGRMNTRSAVVDVRPGTPRQTVFDCVLNQVQEDYGQVSVLFYDLQPATL